MIQCRALDHHTIEGNVYDYKRTIDKTRNPFNANAYGFLISLLFQATRTYSGVSSTTSNVIPRCWTLSTMNYKNLVEALMGLPVSYT